jgi:hypothetical protein
MVAPRRCNRHPRRCNRQVNQYPVDAAWKPLEDGKDYKMAILDFILTGGDGYGMVPAGVR